MAAPQSAPAFTGLDLGINLTGWCHGSGLGLPEADRWRFIPTGEDLGWLVEQFDEALSLHIEQRRPSVIAYEAPLMLRTDKMLTLRKTYALGAHLEWVARRRGIECGELDLRDIKRELGGATSSSKADMVAAAEKLGVALPSGPGREDAADALGAWLLLLRLRNRALSVKFDQALWGGRANALI